jgi:predicted DNA-binding transcriptional regulator YafY
MVMDASRPASRLLAMLELLQDRPGITGPRLAEELGVSGRTVRRYVTTLQDMGIPVEPTAGRLGGYWLRPGFRLPPLMFSAEEAIGLAVALLATRPTADAEVPPSVTSALGKIERVLPKELADRVATVRDGISLPESSNDTYFSFPNPNVLAMLAQATLTRQRCWIRYSRPDGDESAREIDPYGVGALYGRWYVHAWCHLRNDRRTFRVDRIRRIDVLPATFEPPEGIDVIAAIEESLAMARSEWKVEIVVEAPLDIVRDHVPRQFAVLEPIDADRTRLRASTSNLDWYAWRISSLPFPMTVIEPQELRETFRNAAERLAKIANADAVGVG